MRPDYRPGGTFVGDYLGNGVRSISPTPSFANLGCPPGGMGSAAGAVLQRPIASSGMALQSLSFGIVIFVNHLLMTRIVCIAISHPVCTVVQPKQNRPFDDERDGFHGDFAVAGS